MNRAGRQAVANTDKDMILLNSMTCLVLPRMLAIISEWEHVPGDAVWKSGIALQHRTVGIPEC